MKPLRLLPFLLVLGLFMGSAQSLESLPLDDFALPKSIGTIETRFTGEPGRWIIHIQDVHAHLTAQENITAIIDHLHEIYGINTVALEGGWDTTNFQVSQALPSSQAKQMLARGLLEENLITGPAYSALFASAPIQLVGIEDKDLYEQNRKLYVEHLKHRDEIVKRYHALHEQLWDQKQKVYNQNLLVFDAHLMEFRSGKKAEKFIPALITRGQEDGIDLSELPQIDLFRQVLEIEDSLNKQKLESEAKRLMEAFKKEGLHFEELLKSGKIPAERLEHYPEVLKYKELMTFEERVKHREFFEEIEEAIRRFKNKLFISDEEKILDEKSEALLLAGKIMLLESTPNDLKKFELLNSAITEEVAQAGLSKALELGMRFYELAKKRDEIFFEKLQTDPALKGNIAIVTGGFHTEGLDALFSDAKISHIVVTPDLGEKLEINEKKYFERLSEILPETQTLADIRNRFLDPRFDQAFAKGVESLTLNKNIAKAIQIVTGAEIGAAVRNPLNEQKSGIPFDQLSPEEQKNLVSDLRKMQAGKQRITMIIKTSVLKKLLADPVGLSIWENEIKPYRENSVLVVQDTDDVLTETLGAKALVKRVRGDLSEVIRTERAKRDSDKLLIGVIDDEFTGDVLVLKSHPVAMLLLRPILEHKDSRVDTTNPEILDAIKSLLETSYKTENLLAAAA